jgi:hypothetical protein
MAYHRQILNFLFVRMSPIFSFSSSTVSLGIEVAMFRVIGPCSPYVQHFTKALAASWFLVRLVFEPEDGDDMYLRNVGSDTD